MSQPLILNLELARAEQADDAFAFRFSPQVYLSRSEGGGVKTAQLDWSQELIADIAAVRLPGRDAALAQRLGETLRRFLQTSTWPAQEAQILAAVQAERPIILTLRFAAAELYALPWELLTISSTGQCLAELPSLLLRYEWPETVAAPVDPSTQKELGRILFAWSAAAGAVPASEQLSAIEFACRRGFFPFDESCDILENVSCRRLTAALELAKKEGAPIAVLHLLCHGAASGQTFGLAFDGDRGEGAVIVDAAKLRQLLAPYAGMVRLVVLSACDSGNTGALGNQLGSVAQTLHRAGIARVVASRFPLTVHGSVQFCEAFYRELLGPPESVEAALLVARQQLALDPTQLDWASIQLYAHAADGANGRPILFRPYRGLLAYQPEHRRFFFGRDREIAELVSDLKSLREKGEARLLALDGASGTGKSSLLFAGAMPQLLDLLGKDATVCRMRPGSTAEQALDEALANRTDQQPLLLIIDQFEELFTHVEDARARQAFARRIYALASDANSQINVIITLRSDFVGRCGELVINDQGLRLDRLIFDEAHRVSVAQMDPQQMREVITRPAQRVGLQLASGLAERMLHDVDSEPGALPLLADTLDLLWQRRSAQTLTQEAYDAIGGVTGALHGRADALIDSLGEEERQQARRLLVRLGSGVTDGKQGVRLRVRVSARRPEDARQSVHFDHALFRLCDARLLVLDRDKDGETIEVAHEALLRKWPRLINWVREDYQQLLQLETLEAWVKEAAASRTLLSADRLAYAEKVAADNLQALSKEARQLLQDSRAARRKSEEHDRFARDALRMLAVGALKHDPTRQVALLREAESEDPSVVPGWLGTSYNLLETNAFTLRELKAPTTPILFASMTPDAARIVVLCNTSTPMLLDASGQTAAIPLVGHSDTVNTACFSPNGSRLFTGCDGGIGHLWNRDGRADPRILSGHMGAIVSASWSADSKQLVTTSVDGTARIWQLGSAAPPIVLTHKCEVRAAVFSSDGTRVMTTDAEGGVRIFQLGSKDKPIVVTGRSEQAYNLQWSAGGTHVVAMCMDGSTRIWNATGRGKTQVLFDKPDQTASTIQLSPDGRQLAVSSTQGTNIYDLQNLESVRALGGEISANSLVWSADNQKIAAAFSDATITVWDAGDSLRSLTLRGHSLVQASGVRFMSFSADGRRLLTGTEMDPLRIWDLDREELRSAPKRISSTGKVPYVFRGDTGERGPPAVTQNGVEASFDFESGKVVVIRQHGGQPVLLQAQQAREGGLVCLALSPDGSRVAAGRYSGQAVVWNSDGRGEPLVLECVGPVTLVCFSPDGERLLTLDMDSALRIWWLNSGRCERIEVSMGSAPGAIRADWQMYLQSGISSTMDDLDQYAQPLRLSSADIRDRLVGATTICLTVAERMRYLSEPADLAAQNYQQSVALVQRKS